MIWIDDRICLRMIGWVLIGILFFYQNEGIRTNMVFLIVIAALAVCLGGLGIAKKPGSVYKNDPKEWNPMEGKRVRFVEDDTEEPNADGVCGHLEAVGDSSRKPSFYEKVVKRGIDLVLSFFGLIILSPAFLALCIWIVIDDPGPVFFTQKRVGRNQQFFKLHKFRSMRTDTPHNVPTHMLGNPEQYITRAGRFIRSHSLDELPQIWDIFLGNMSVVGPRPALWNQDLLIAYRDAYSANEVKPGLTGWAQINGRDELEIVEKAKLDGEYCHKISLGFDLRCFLGTIFSVIKSEGVVEGGTGELHKKGDQSR